MHVCMCMWKNSRACYATRERESNNNQNTFDFHLKYKKKYKHINTSIG